MSRVNKKNNEERDCYLVSGFVKEYLQSDGLQLIATAIHSIDITERDGAEHLCQSGLMWRDVKKRRDGDYQRRSGGMKGIERLLHLLDLENKSSYS